MATKTKKPNIAKAKVNKNSITKDMTFSNLLEKNPEAINVLFENGLHCIGCHMSAFETIEQGCLAHGMNKKQIEDLIKKLNKKR